MSEDIKVTDQEALDWVSKLSDSDKEELKRQALLKRAIDLAQPKAEPNLGAMTPAEFEAYKRSLGF